MAVQILRLGQAGFRLRFGDITCYLDPYLSDQVEKAEGPALRRLIPAPLAPGDITDADYVLISHIHMDHCDIDTLLPLSQASLGAKFLGSREVVRFLEREGIPADRLIIMNQAPVDLPAGLRVHPVPAAHKTIESDADGFWRYLGYVICYEGKRYLHTGDSCVHDLLIAKAREIGPIDVAFLPVNECNFYRDRAGIIGNMSIRDAFKLAVELGAKRVVPMHYDMFEANQVYREEIEIVYSKQSPPFILDLDPREA